MTSTRTTTTDQVSIAMEDINNANKKKDSLTNETVSVDGPHLNRTVGHRRHNSHGSNGSDHRNYSGENDADDRSRIQHHQHQHRERRRSRSPSHSPSRRKRSTDVAVPSTENDVSTNFHDVEPLIETEVHRKVKQTELDEDSDDSITETQHEDNSGVDDGFFVGERRDTGNDSDHKHNVSNNNGPHQPNGGNDLRPFPTLSPSFGVPSIILDAEGRSQVIPDINVYQQKKNLAQGMMDLALLSANANQLRYVLETYVRHPYFWFSVVFIILSLLLQIAVGVGLILNSRYNIKNKDQICRADKINNFTIVGIFLITTVNVFITAFGVANPPASSK